MKTNEYRMRSFLSDIIPFKLKLNSTLRHTRCEMILAGGAVRDYILNRPISDFDVYLFPAATLKGSLSILTFTYDVIEAITRMREFEIAPLKHSMDAYLDFIVLNTESDCGPIQFIIDNTIYPSLTHKFQTFDCTLSQIWLQRDEVYLTPEARYDIRAKILRFKHNTTERYKHKLISKYPDYRVYEEVLL